jgi:hypothetical protein
MAEPLAVPQTSQRGEESEKYYNFQIKGWLNFDPVDKTLANVAQRIEVGDGFVSVVDVLKVERNLAAIDDDEVREGFENLRAAKRLIQNARQLPTKLIEELRAALRVEREITIQQNVTAISASSVRKDQEIQVTPWP